MDLGLGGKRVIVAGASAGLGLGCAKALAGEGAVVAMGSRTALGLNRAAEEINDAVEASNGAGRAIPIVADVSTPQGATDFVTKAIEALGGVDILVTNAGGPPAGNFASIELDQYPAAIDLNLMSVVAMCQSAVPHMQEQGWGRVVAITSISVRQPIAQLILSNTARAGATAFLKTLATEVAGDGVTVNSLQPGLHETKRITDLYADNVAQAAASVPANKLGDPDDFGKVATFLCSDAARFITGAAIPIDGGSASGLQ